MNAIIALLPIIIQELPGAITTVEQLYSLAEKFFAVQNGRPPTQAETDDLHAQIDSDVAEALTPLPDAQPGDPDYVKP